LVSMPGLMNLQRDTASDWLLLLRHVDGAKPALAESPAGLVPRSDTRAWAPGSFGSGQLRGVSVPRHPARL
jgi:hypothetical protein